MLYLKIGDEGALFSGGANKKRLKTGGGTQWGAVVKQLQVQEEPGKLWHIEL